MEHILEQNNLITIVAVGIIVLITARYWEKSKFFLIEILPQIGMLGTFFGIVYALAFLDPDNINNSIPYFIGGMRVVFISTFLSLFIIVCIKFLHQDTFEISNEDSSAQILSLLKENNEELVKINTTVNKKNDELISEFKDFANKQAENNANSLIEALKNVMKDFNVKISEQFGDNFKQLNIAVGKLLEWQENYYKQIKFISERLDDNADLMEKNREIISDVSKKYSDGLHVSENLEKTILNLEAQRKVLEEDMKKFSEFSSSAAKDFPKISENIQVITTGFKDAVDDSMNVITKTVDQQGERVDQNMEKLAEIYENSVEVLSDNISSSVNKVLEKVNKAIESQSDSLESNIEKINDSYDKSTSSLIAMQNDMKAKQGESISEAIQVLNTGLETLLNQSLEALGQHLTAISRRFTDDYSVLAKKLNKITDMTKHMKDYD